MTPPLALARYEDVPVHSPAWHDLRRGGLGSADAAAAAGVDPWRSGFALWAEKTAASWPQQESAALTWGVRLEAAVAEHFAEAHPEYAVEMPPAIYVHPERPWMRASPDRLLRWGFTESFVQGPSDQDAILEIKTSRLDHAWEDGPPDYVVVQVQHQLAVMDLSWAYVAVLLHGRDYREYRLERDEELIGYLYTIEELFWNRVLDGTPPPVDGTDATTDALRALFIGDPDATVDLPEEARRLISDTQRARAYAKDCQSEARRLENALKLMLGDATVGLLDGRAAVTWKTSVRRSIDPEALRAAHPAIAEEFTNETDVRTLRFPKGDK